MTTIFINNYTDVQVDIKPEMVDAGVQCIRSYLQPRTKDASVQCKLDAPIITSSPLKEYPYTAIPLCLSQNFQTLKGVNT